MVAQCRKGQREPAAARQGIVGRGGAAGVQHWRRAQLRHAVHRDGPSVLDSGSVRTGGAKSFGSERGGKGGNQAAGGGAPRQHSARPAGELCVHMPLQATRPTPTGLYIVRTPTGTRKTGAR